MTLSVDIHFFSYVLEISLYPLGIYIFVPSSVES